MTTLYLSPHLDDVALSCAGGLLHARARGERVIVATVFTEGRGQAARRREDIAALRSIGAEPLHLGFLDAPDRLHLKPGFASLVLEPEVELALVSTISRQLRALLANVRPARICFPLGVGGHIDHRTLFECAARVAATAEANGVALRFYEERPYSFVPALRVLRLLELRGGRRRASPDSIDAELGRIPLLNSFPGRAARADCLAQLAQRLSTAHPRRMRLCARMQSFQPTVLEAAAQLIARYQTQRTALFGDRSIQSLYAEHSLDRRGRFIERTFT